MQRRRLYIENSLNMIVSPRNIGILNNTVQQFLDMCQIDRIKLRIKKASVGAVYLDYQINDFYMNFCLEMCTDAVVVLRVGPFKI